MVIAIFPDIIKVIVLSTCTNTLLGIDSALQAGKVGAWVSGAEKNGLELVHARICKK